MLMLEYVIIKHVENERYRIQWMNNTEKGKRGKGMITNVIVIEF